MAWTAEETKKLRRSYCKAATAPRKAVPPCAELDAISEEWDLVTTHKHGSKAYVASARVVAGLTRGFTKVFKCDELDQIRDCMCKIFDAATIEYFLSHPFTEDERYDIYNRLHNSQRLAYGGRGKKISLAEAFCSYEQGYSKLLYVWARMPQPKREPLVVLNEEQEEAYDWVRLASLEKYEGIWFNPRRALINLNRWYNRNKGSWTRGMRLKFGDFVSFVRELIAYAEDYGGAKPELILRPDRSWLIRRFVATWRQETFDQLEEDEKTRQIALASLPQAERERMEAAYRKRYQDEIAAMEQLDRETRKAESGPIW